MITLDHTRDRLGFCHSCGARNGEGHHHEPVVTPDDALAALAHNYVVVDGYFIPPHMIHTRTPDRVVCTNGKTIRTGTA